MQSKTENWNLNDSAPVLPGGQIYIAFPGLGKTTYARQHCNVVDLDFGTYRSARMVSPNEQKSLYPEFSRYVKYWFKDGWIVLTNDQGLIPYLKQFAEGRIVVELPENVNDLVLRVARREKVSGKNQIFANALAKNAFQWVEGWQSYARKYNIPVIHTKFFKEVPMPYESSSK